MAVNVPGLAIPLTVNSKDKKLKMRVCNIYCDISFYIMIPYGQEWLPIVWSNNPIYRAGWLSSWRLIQKWLMRPTVHTQPLNNRTVPLYHGISFPLLLYWFSNFRIYNIYHYAYWTFSGILHHVVHYVQISWFISTGNYHPAYYKIFNICYNIRFISYKWSLK